MPQRQLFKMPWPRAGFVENTAQTEQPDGTTTNCLNVRNYDTLDRRNRGGKRTGLTKVNSAQFNSDNAMFDWTDGANRPDSAAMRVGLRPVCQGWCVVEVSINNAAFVHDVRHSTRHEHYGSGRVRSIK